MSSTVASKENSDMEFTDLESCQPPSPRNSRPLQPVASFTVEGKKNPLAPLSANVIPKNLPIKGGKSHRESPLMPSSQLNSSSSGSFNTCAANMPKTGPNGLPFVFPEEQQEKVVETLRNHKATKHMPLTPLRQQPAGRHLGGTRRGSSAERPQNPSLALMDDSRGEEHLIGEDETTKMFLRAAQVSEGVKPHTPSPQHDVRPGNGPKRGGRPTSFARKQSDLNGAPPPPAPGGGNPRNGNGSFGVRRMSTVSEASSVPACNKCLDLGDVTPIVEAGDLLESEDGDDDDDDDSESSESQTQKEDLVEEEEDEDYTVVPVASSSDNIDLRVLNKAEELLSCGFGMALGSAPVTAAATALPVEPDTLSHDDIFFFQAVEEAEETALPPLHVAAYFSPPPAPSLGSNSTQHLGEDLEQEDILGLLGSGVVAGFGIGGIEEAGAKDVPPPRRKRTGADDCEPRKVQNESAEHSPLPTLGGKYAAAPAASVGVPRTEYVGEDLKLPSLHGYGVTFASASVGSAGGAGGGGRSVSTTESMAMGNNHCELMGLEIQDNEDNQRALLVALEDEMGQAILRAFNHELSSIYAWELQGEEAAKKRAAMERAQDEEKKRIEAAEADAKANKTKLLEELDTRAAAAAAAAGQQAEQPKEATSATYTARRHFSSDHRLVELGDNHHTARARRYASVTTDNVSDVAEAAQGDASYFRLAANSASKNWVAVHLDQYNEYYRFSWFYRKGLEMLIRYQQHMDAKVHLLQAHFAWQCRILHKEYQVVLLENHNRTSLTYLALNYFPEVVAHAWDKSIIEQVTKQSLSEALLIAAAATPPPRETPTGRRSSVLASNPAVLPPPPPPSQPGGRGGRYQRATPPAEGADTVEEV